MNWHPRRTILSPDAAVAKVLGQRHKATTVDLCGHLRKQDSATVADLVGTT